MELVYEDDNGNLTSITFDATVSELHSNTAVVTEHPVEVGADVADHVQAQPARLTATVFLTNTPVLPAVTFLRGAEGRTRSIDLKPTGKAQVLAFDGEFDRVRDVHSYLVELQRAGAIVRILNSLHEYEDMVISSISAPREQATSEAITLELELVQVRFAESDVVAAPEPREPRGVPEQNAGAQPAVEETSPAQQERSRSAWTAITEYLSGGG